MGLTVVLLLAGTTVGATDLDFGTSFGDDAFELDNDIAFIDFTVGAYSNVTLFTSSWLQGVPPAGFDPALAVWGSDGGRIAFQDDGNNVGTTVSNGVPYDHGLWDVYLELPLAAGAYLATLSQYDNRPLGMSLSDGFFRDGDPDFTRPWGSQPYFNGRWYESVDDTDDPRTANWDLHILVTPAQSVPEPSTWLLLGLGGLAVAGLRRRR